MEHKDEPQPPPVFVREPVVHGVSVPVLSNDHPPLDHRFIVDRPSPEHDVQDQHTQETDGMFPLTLLGYVMTLISTRCSFDR
jgi:hypothetical protein